MIAGGLECMVDGCPLMPDEQVLLDIDGLLLRFALCIDHADDIRWGLMAADPSNLTRGLIGPA